MKKTMRVAVSSLCVAVVMLVQPAASFAHGSDSATTPASASLTAPPAGQDVTGATPVPADEVIEDTDLRIALATLSQYVVEEPTGQRSFDTERAAADHASEYLMTAGAQFNQVSGSQDHSGGGILRLSLPGYGNWCGPGNSGPGAPVNTLDSLCQQHDLCYRSLGYFACPCDEALWWGISSRDFNGFGENAAALAIATYFSAVPCRSI